MTNNNTVADMVKSILIDDEIMTEKLREQIKKALRINNHLTTTYALQLSRVQDIKGKDSKTSGWYFILTGTRCGVNFFLNNDMEIVRKPSKNQVKVMQEYSLYNHREFNESFWYKNFR